MTRRHEMEPIIREWLQGSLDPIPDPVHRYPVVAARVSELPQGRSWLPRRKPWRLPAMSITTTSLMASIIVALFGGYLIGSAVTEPRPVPASQDGTARVVAADGSGDHVTIAAAVAAAADGDTLRIKPGVYREAVIVDKDVVLIGDGPRDEIIIEAPDDGPTATALQTIVGRADVPYTMLFRDSAARLSDITVRGQRSGLRASGGAPVIQRVRLEGVGEAYDGNNTDRMPAILIDGGSNALIRGNELVGGGPIDIQDASSPTVSRNRLVDGPHVWGSPGDGTSIRGNTIEGALVQGIVLLRASTTSIEGNVIVGAPIRGILTAGGETVSDNTISDSAIGIALGPVDPSSVELVTVAGNRLIGNGTAIDIGRGAPARIADNELVDNAIGIGLSETDVLVEGNSIAGGTTGIIVTSGARPTLDSNTVERHVTGVLIDVGASATLRGNRLCGNETNLHIADGAGSSLLDNEICADGRMPADG